MILKFGIIRSALLTLMIAPTFAKATINTTTFAQAGQSESAELQAALTYCSDHGEVCEIPANKMYTISTDLFIWGNASLVGGGQNSGIIFMPDDASRALLQVGLAPQQFVYHATTPYIPKPVFKGRIANLTLKVDSSITRSVMTALDNANPDPAPEKIFRPYKLIYFWRTDGAEIANNYVDVGDSKYGFTSSGNNADFVPAGTSNPGLWTGSSLVRKNIRIINNRVISGDYRWTLAHNNSSGNEGIALALFNGAYIAHNTISGFGDDVIAFHYGSNAIIEQNYGDSVDGRIYASGSSCVAILYNDVVRRPTTLYKASGYEEFPNGWGLSLITLDGETRSATPTQNIVYGNKLFVPAGLREDGMRIDSARATKIVKNSLYQPANSSEYGPISSATLPIKTGLRLRRMNHDSIIANYPVPNCFEGTNLNLPNGLSFLPVVGDNYANAISTYMPSKNVLITDNLFSPSTNGAFTAANIALIEHPTVAAIANREPSEALFGNISAASCNNAIIVGTHACHSVAIINNRLNALPWQVCNQTQLSNLPEAGITLDPFSCLYYQNAVADFNAGNVTRLQRSTSTPDERIYYDNNSTEIDGTASTLQSTFSIPGVIPSEYFHDAYPNTLSSYPTDKKCRNPFGKILGSILTMDHMGECDLKGMQSHWVEYNLNVLETGTYSLNLRARGVIPTNVVNVSIDDQPPFALNITNGGYKDNRISNLQLTSGAHKVRIKFISGLTYLNYLKFEIFR